MDTQLEYEDKPEVLSLLELAEYLGVSPTLLKRLMRIRKLPYTKIGRRVVFYMPVIIDWLEKNTVQPGPHPSDWHRKQYDPVQLLAEKYTKRQTKG